MKKTFFFAAAAALVLGLTACTDEPIIPGEIEDIPQEVSNPMVKSTSDLIGTEWVYNLTENVQFGGDVVAFDLDMEFGLNFDEEYAHLVFPENTVMLTLSDDYTLEEVGAMNFAYNYEMATTSGTLTAIDNDITGEAIGLTFNFTYDEQNDIITVPLMFAQEGNEDEATAFNLVFKRK